MDLSQESTRISSPDELSRVMQQIKEWLERGVLRQLKPPAVAIQRFEAVEEDFLDMLNTQQAWPDMIEYLFEDTQGKRYRLVAETYHGSGGSWGPA